MAVGLLFVIWNKQANLFAAVLYEDKAEALARAAGTSFDSEGWLWWVEELDGTGRPDHFPHRNPLEYA